MAQLPPAEPSAMALAFDATMRKLVDDSQKAADADARQQVVEAIERVGKSVGDAAVAQTKVSALPRSGEGADLGLEPASVTVCQHARSSALQDVAELKAEMSGVKSLLQRILEAMDAGAVEARKRCGRVG